MTAPHFADDQVTLYHGDCIQVLRSDDYGYDWNLGYREPRLFADNSVDAVVCDPPYGLEFMGKDWDAPWKTGNGFRRAENPSDAGRDNVFGRQSKRGPEYFAGAEFQQWCTAWASECLRILKPGGHMVAFGGSRTWHRLASAIEDAGFEVRDSIAWLYGSGFPKSLDVAKAIDKSAGYVGEVVGTESVDVGMQGGHMHTGRDRNVVSRDVRALSPRAEQWQGWGTALKPSFEPIVVARKPLSDTVAGNVLEYGTGALNIDGCRIEAHDDQLAAKYASVQKAGPRENAIYGRDNRDRAGSAPNDAGRWPTNVVLDGSQADVLDQQSGITRDGTAVRRNGGGQTIFGHSGGVATPDASYGGQGGASRFFPVFHYGAKAPSSERPSANGVAHPTVKPLDLMRWLVRLVTPPNGLVLEPFAGSGTTAEACIHEHMRCIAIEREADYLPLITARLTKPLEIGFDFGAGAS
ncbi:DNA-methyltransferase [Mycolicibacterium fortuitum]|uniref:DNA-methyltransferase n=1 Tax=Mycolicibacterium fortuitum TaxID=1766 RepID=UPI00096EF0C7|nr:site-specific DNA-methyltransferase [Mycolicibacterium fortuitum]OMC12522.1 DNA methylase [Mycolicibacterium fortuitum]